MKHRWAVLLALACVGLGSGAEPYALTGVVVDEAGQPVAGVEVQSRVAQNWLPPAPMPATKPPTRRAVTGDDGRYRIPCDPPGTSDHYAIVVVAPDWLLLERGVLPDKARASGEVTPAVVWRVDQTVAGTVTDAAGRPVGGTTVFATDHPAPPVTTDADGRFLLTRMRPGTNQIAAVWGTANRATGAAQGGRREADLVEQPSPDRTPEADRALAGELLSEAYTIAKGLKPGTPWIAVGVGLNEFDDTLAWPQVAALGGHWMRDKARQEMLGNAAMADPDWAVSLLPYLAEFSDTDQQQLTTVLLAYLLQPTHPEEATRLITQSLNGPPLVKSKSNTAMYEVLLTASLCRLGRVDEAMRRFETVQANLAQVPGYAGMQAYQMLGWYFAEWPDLLVLLLTDVPDESFATIAELTSLRHEARRDPHTAATLLPDLAPQTKVPRTTPGAVPLNPAWAEGEFYRAVPAVAVELLLADADAGRAFLAPLPPRVQADVYGWAASRTADDAAAQAFVAAAFAVLAGPALRDAAADSPRVFGARYRSPGPSAPGLVARLQRLQRRRGWPVTAPPATVGDDLDAPAAFYSAEVEPNRAWLYADPVYRQAEPGGWRPNPSWTGLCLILCASQLDRAVTIARQGVPGVGRLGDEDRLYALCSVARWLLATPAERAEMVYSADSFQYAMLPWTHDVAW